MMLDLATTSRLACVSASPTVDRVPQMHCMEDLRRARNSLHPKVQP